MKKKSAKIWIATMIFMALMVTAFSLSVSAQVEASGLPFGTQVGEYNGVAAYSNYENDYVSNEYNYIDEYNTGMKWQCVEYVNRYYYTVYGLEIRIPGTNAEDYYNTASDRGLVAYPNGDTTSPQPGDILCSNGGTLGHVAIVREVMLDSVHVIHQNWANTEADNDKTISMSVSDGHYTVSGFSGSYPVLGWLRKPAEVIYVPDDYAKIQWAVDNASVGDTIVVRDGTYVENIDINKRLTIKSENGWNSTIVQAADPYDDVLEVTADYVEISGFTMTESRAYAGIYLYYADYCNISNNNCSNNVYGILLNYSDNNSITKSICSLNIGYGISLRYSNNSSITNSVISSNSGDGIVLANSNSNKLTGNIMIKDGIVIAGDLLEYYTHDIDTSNTVNGKPVYYWRAVKGGKVPEVAGQVILVNCSDVAVENQNLHDSFVGILVAFSSFITIKNNNCSNDIEFWYSNNSIISNNNCSNCSNAIELWYSNNGIISNNNCSNGDGIFLVISKTTIAYQTTTAQTTGTASLSVIQITTTYRTITAQTTGMKASTSILQATI